MSDSIVTIGPHRRVHEAFDPLWAELEVEHHRFISTEAALEVLRSGEPPSAVLISYPLWDAKVEDILAAMSRILGPERVGPVVVLAPPESLLELAPLEDRGIRVLSEGLPAEELRQTLGDLLGRARRRDPRFMVRMAVKVEAGAILRACQSVDISLSGMLIRTSEEFPIGTEVELEFVLEDDEESLRCRAEVMRYTRPHAEKGRGMGVRFLSFAGDGRQRLEEFLAT